MNQDVSELQFTHEIIYKTTSNATVCHQVQITSEMYDKILRHRHAIEAHLAASNGGHQRLHFDTKFLVASLDSEEDLEETNKLISSYMLHQKDDPHSHHADLTGDLGLTHLTTNLAIKMEKIPLASAASWDPPTTSSYVHHQVTRAVSDSIVRLAAGGGAPTPTTMTTSDCNRRKLESEDSSYGSDHEHHTNVLDNKRPISTTQVWTSSHEDVSRTVSETLAGEYVDYVDHYDSVESIMRDESYADNLCRALKLGYTEIQLQKALMKLGKKARDDQILEELIRIYNSSKRPALDHHEAVESLRQDLKSMDLSNSNSSCTEETNSSGDHEDHLLPIIIDGSNVAMSHGNKERFSCRGIRIAVDWFRNRGHKEITVFVPLWRKESSKPETPTTDQHILTELERETFLTFTPSRQVLGRRYVCHDDRYILNLAGETGGIVVSNDNYRELINEKPKYKEVIEERILMYSFVNDRFMPPDDPCGKNGPTLDQFLRKKVKLPSQLPQPCPYDKKCTYGNKCKFYHPDRVTNQKSITDKLKEHSSQRINEVRARVNSRDSSPGDPLTRTRSIQPKQELRSKQAVCRTKSSMPRLATGEHHWQQQQAWPVFDSSMPPPPPRTPWSLEQQSAAAGSTGAGSAPPSNPTAVNSHTKLSRQLTLNPNFDPRIHQLHHHHQLQDFSRPPPPLPGQHMVVTRNASEPDSAFLPAAPNHQQPPLVQQVVHHQNDLHKTWSTPLESSSNSAVSPIFGVGPMRNVWESLRAGQTAASPHEDARSKMYFILAQLFDEDTVRRAMASLPNETDPKVICSHICAMQESQHQP